MSEWKEVRLGDVANYINRGFSPKYTDNNGTCIINQRCIRNGVIDLSIARLTSSEKKVTKEKILQVGDILINSTGVGTAGRVAIFNSNITATVDTHVTIVRTNSGIIYPLFTFYNLRSREQEIEGIAEGSTGQIELKRTTVQEILIPLPPLPEQRAIADVLSSLDDKIDLLHRQNQTLESLAQTLFRQWFIEEADEDWEEGVLGDFFQPQKGKNLTRKQMVEGNFPVVAGGLEPSGYHNEGNTKAPVVTISASGANAGFVRLFHAPVWSSDSSFIDETITPYVYFSYVFLKFNQERIFDKQEGSAQPHIYPRHIAELDCLSYPDDLLAKFEETVKSKFQKIKANIAQIRTLENLRDTLLPKLMSGEVKVVL